MEVTMTRPIEAGFKAMNECWDDDGDDRCALRCGITAAVEGMEAGDYD